MKSLLAAASFGGGSSASRRPLVRLLGVAPAALLLSGLFVVWAGPLAAPVAAAAPTGTVVAWGSDDKGQATVPAGLSGVTAVSAGYMQSLALKSDGTVVAWGQNSMYEQATVPAGLSGVVAISAGVLYSLALKSDGTVVAWGYHGSNEVTVPAGLSGVVAIAAGYYQYLALKSDGTVVAWGSDGCGGSEADVPAGLSGVVAITAGYCASLALKSDGTVVAWGIGYGTTDVPAGLSGVIAIAAGYDHALALKSDGTVVAWGDNYYGQATVPTGLSGVTAIAAGERHSLALKSNGTVVAWGFNDCGQATVPAGLASVVAISAGEYHSLALVAPPLVVSTASVSVAGVAHSVTVTAKDADGTIYPAYRGTIHFTSSDPAAVLPSNYTFTAADAGVHTFSGGLTLKTAGSRSVTATDTVKGTITGVQNGIIVTPAAATTLAVSTASPYGAGVAHNVTVTARDPYGNSATGYRGTIHFSSSDSAAVLPANYTFTAADAGHHVFTLGLTLKTSGSRSVTAKDTVTAAITGTQSSIVVTPRAATHLAVSTATSSAAGVAHNVTITVRDTYGNTVTGYLGRIHFTSSDAAAVLPPDYRFTAADAGVHTFTLGVKLKTVGTQWIRVADKVTPTIAGVQTGIIVS